MAVDSVTNSAMYRTKIYRAQAMIQINLIQYFHSLPPAEANTLYRIVDKLAFTPAYDVPWEH